MLCGYHALHIMIMDNQVNNTHTFINNNNFNNANSLTHLLETGEPEVEVANLKLSEYCDISTLSKSLQNTKGGLSILSLHSLAEPKRKIR